MTTPHSIHGKSKTPVPDVLQVHSFPYHVLMGDWMIVGSSLKLWKNRSDVLCRYTPHSVPTPEKQAELRQSAKTADPVSFSDEIWWEQLDKKGGHQKGKGAPREKQSIVRGKNKIDPKGVNGASYLWRGYNFLKPFTSNWQVVAYSHNFLDATGSESQATPAEPIWIVTYFTATLFTDAGIDLYVRGTLTDEEYNTIVESLRAHQGDTEADKELQRLAKDLFKIPVGNI